MVDNIAELNRLLMALQLLADKKKAAPIEAVLDQCRSTVIEGRMPDHLLTVEFASMLGFIRKKGNKLAITELGETLLLLNRDRTYDIAEEQKRLLLRICFLQGPLRTKTRRLLKCFSPSYRKNTFQWSAIDGPRLDAEDWLVEHLRQLGLLTRSEEGIYVSEKYVRTVSTFLEEVKGWTEEEAEEYFKEKREIGILAEELIVRYEVDRLKNVGCEVEAHCVRRISLVRANAGYDVESFDGITHDVNPDRYIEVKGTRGEDLRFFWTENEINIARILRNKYWIYFQGGINLANRQARNEPLMFRDPQSSLLKDARIKATPQGLVVEGKMRGVAR